MPHLKTLIRFPNLSLAKMPSSSLSVSELRFENGTFSPSFKPPGSANSLFLGGAGLRGMEMGGKFTKFTTIAVYLEETAVALLADKWRRMTAVELTESVEFFTDIITGPFEKLLLFSLIMPLKGKHFAERVAEICVPEWKSVGIYTDSEAKAIDEFFQVFNDVSFPRGASVLFTTLSNGSLSISFSKDGSVPEVVNAVIKNKLMSEAVLASIIGKHGICYATKQSLATRLSKFFLEE